MRSQAHLTCGVDFWRALRVWCMDMISWPHSASENAQKSTTCRIVRQHQSCAGLTKYACDACDMGQLCQKLAKVSRALSLCWECICPEYSVPVCHGC